MCSVVVYVWQGWYPKKLWKSTLYVNQIPKGMLLLSVKGCRQCFIFSWASLLKSLFYLLQAVTVSEKHHSSVQKMSVKFLSLQRLSSGEGVGKERLCERGRDAATWNSWFPLLWKPQDPTIPFDLTHTEHWQSFQLKNDVTFVCVSMWVTLITSSACAYFTYFPLY